MVYPFIAPEKFGADNTADLLVFIFLGLLDIFSDLTDFHS